MLSAHAINICKLFLKENADDHLFVVKFIVSQCNGILKYIEENLTNECQNKERNLRFSGTLESHT